MIQQERIVYRYTLLICLYSLFLSVVRIVILGVLYLTRKRSITMLLLQNLSISFYLLTFFELLVYLVIAVYAYLTLNQLKKGQSVQHKLYVSILCYSVFNMGLTTLLGVNMLRFVTPVFLATFGMLSLLNLRKNDS
ncbi:hypothetical protein [Isobaculum melis]|uniref:Uncharacterized protein n=1 Tax=Isobaculum melis TaxID=142588 RepID=A0A1H9TCB5_9LACT|nr:hypothetical protein [Isobaculum melis]SER94594.1 hypothetical protein SAMN04488559_11217 [Isobaculum melis]